MMNWKANEFSANYQMEKSGASFRSFLIFFIPILLLFAERSFAQVFTEEELLETIQAAKNKPEEKLDGLLELAKFYKNVQNRESKSDSLLNEALMLSKSLDNQAGYFKTLEYYIELKNLARHSKEAEALARACMFEGKNEAFSIRKWYGNYFLSKISFAKTEYADALNFANESSRIADRLGNSRLKIKSTIQTGQCENRLGNNVESFNYLVKALDLLERHPDQLLLMEAYDALWYFYLYNNRPAKAIEYSNEKLRIVESLKPVDSLQWINTQFQILQCDMEGNNKIPLDWLVECINITNRKGYVAVKDDLWALYRSYLIRNELFDQLYQLYNIEFPEELVEIHKTNRKLYVRLMAYFSEIEGNISASEKYWEEAMRFGSSEPDQFMKINLYIRYAQFLLRQGQYSQVAAILQEAYSSSKEIPYLPFMIEALSTLEGLYLTLGEHDKAYAYAEERHMLNDSLNRQNKSEAVMNMELDYATRRINEQRQREKEFQQEQIRQEQIKSQALGIGLMVFLLLSGLIFRQYRQTNKERKRSDELLLNILPEQTASELKNKGVTTAKKYEHVTVLFSDFVGFTRVAESLSPEELVPEIDRYFRAFDEIVYRNGLEKIKTIGDAYVAVSGMPEGNGATAKNSARAAIEMMAFVEETKKQRLATGKPHFEMRIGMHSGPVVAGVVGMKKFQYDIWGDTVNMAARMEQNSSPGKINISKTAFEFLKDEASFSFENRGKMEVKGKGETEMWFLSSADAPA